MRKFVKNATEVTYTTDGDKIQLIKGLTAHNNIT